MKQFFGKCVQLLYEYTIRKHTRVANGASHLERAQKGRAEHRHGRLARRQVVPGPASKDSSMYDRQSSRWIPSVTDGDKTVGRFNSSVVHRGWWWCRGEQASRGNDTIRLLGEKDKLGHAWYKSVLVVVGPIAYAYVYAFSLHHPYSVADDGVKTQNVCVQNTR